MGIENAPYADYVARLHAARMSQSEEASAADQLLTLHEAAQARPDGTFLELGTDQGQATKAILNALHGADGLLISVDVEDCHYAGAGPNWQFVQSDSTDIDAILAAAPRLQDGIDLVYVDSLHTVAHVHAEARAWFPYLKPGGRMIFDDVDPTPYMQGHRKDSARKEIGNRAISSLVTALFYANLDSLRMEMKLGSTGLAIWTKTAPMGTDLRPYAPLPPARTARRRSRSALATSISDRNVSCARRILGCGVVSMSEPIKSSSCSFSPGRRPVTTISISPSGFSASLTR